jgi:MFS family permease
MDNQAGLRAQAETGQPASAAGKAWLTFAVVAIGSFLGPLSGSIAIVALPTIAPAYGIDLQSVKWIIIIYLVIMNALLPITGKLGQRLGATYVYLAGFLVFGLGSITCALAPASSIMWLVGARAIQAVGASMIYGISPALITRCVPSHRRSLAFGILGSVVAVGLIVAQPLGVVLCDELSWPWVFWVQVPIALAGAGFGWWLLPKDPPVRGEHLPWANTAAWGGIIAGLTLLGEALSKGLWIEYLPLTVAATMLMVLAFILAELRLGRLFDYSLLRYPAFSQGAFAVMVAYSIMYVMILLTPFYFDDYLQLSTLHKALLFGISPLITVFAGPASGYLADRIGFRAPILTGLGLLVLGYGWMAYSVQTHQLALLGVCLGIAGLGSGLFSGPNYAAMMGCVASHQRNVASSIVSLVRNVSFLLGTSLSAILFNALVWHAGGHAMMLAARSDELAHVVPVEVFTYCFSGALYASAALATIGLLASLRYPNRVHGADSQQPAGA